MNWELHQRTVSISILTEDKAGGFFHNIVFTALFNLIAHVNLQIFILIILVNNKAGMQRGGLMAANGTFGFRDT
jgi:hypothetical protein